MLESTCPGGPEEEYWVVNGREAVKRANRRCLFARNKQRSQCRQLMGDLPRERLAVFEPPFSILLSIFWTLPHSYLP
ncbi:Gag-pol polyprotein [Caligus rogercresseyi]|uniref:Gag-pol polyprotein n=1 Tax=Caligus rogercresseyi TaxID=217165 RepID=A0A7T8JX27_CALRO|nr:Gag-pol polyprotein [Caligus rogercresseyi]